jgi:hypothetical protein
MSTCANCGVDQIETGAFCVGCGSRTEGTVHAAIAPRGESTAIQIGKLFYVRSAASGAVSAPLDEPAIKQGLAQGSFSITDSLWDPDTQQWTMIARSPLAAAASTAASYVRMAASTCPHCGTPLAAVLNRSTVGLVLIIVGVALIPLFGIGIPIWIVGFAIRYGGKGRLQLRCSRCQYRVPQS